MLGYDWVDYDWVGYNREQNAWTIASYMLEMLVDALDFTIELGGTSL